MARIAAVAVVICAMTALLAGPGQSLAHANPSTPAAAAAGSAQHVAGDVLVRFEPGSGPQQRAAALAKLDAGRGEPLPVPGLRLVQVGEVGVARAVAMLERRPGVLYAEPNYAGSWGMTPDDDYFGSQWALENTGMGIDNPPVFGTPDADIDAASAWNLSTGSDGTVLAIADTGIFFDHPDLGGNAYVNPGESGGKAANGVDDDGNGYVDDSRGFDFFGGDNDPFPSDPPASNDQHGTLVASTAGAQGNNSIGVSGVSQNVALMSLRIGDGPTGPVTSNQVLGFAYAGDLGAEVVNLSGGGAGFSQSVLDAIRAAPDTLFVFGAGNGGSDHIGDDNDVSPLYPCNLNEPNVVCVSATDQDDKLAGFSNYGDKSVDLAAPGVNILAATIGTSAATSYDFVDGTSFSSPIVAGAAALYRSRYPAASAADTRHALRAGVDKLAALAGKVETGGRLNLEHTLGIVPPDRSITLDLDARKKQKVRSLKLTLGCGQEACTAELRGKAVAKRKRGGGIILAAGAARRARGKKRFKVKPKTISVAAGETRSERIRFKNNRRSVRRLRKLLKRRAYRKGTKARLKVSARDAAGNLDVERLAVRLKR